MLYHPLSVHSLFFFQKNKEASLSKLTYKLCGEQHWPWQILTDLPKQLTQYIQAIPYRQRIKGNVASTAKILSEDVIIESHAIVEDYAVIQGPAWIGDHATIRTGAYLRSCVVVEQNAVIGHSTEVKNTILLPYAKAAHQSYLGDSILGTHVNIGAGSKTANLRFDRQNIYIRHQSQTYNTARHKLGAIFGNHAQTGCNVVTNPGTIFLPHTVALPATVVTGVIKKTRPSTAYSSTKQQKSEP